MRICSVWRRRYGFKIKSKADIQTLFYDCLVNGGEYFIKINLHHALIIEKDKNGVVSVSEKTGDLKDVFNPMITWSYSEGVQKVWDYRKYINAYFFED